MIKTGSRTRRYLAVSLGSLIVLGCADYATAPTSSLQPPPTTVAFLGLNLGKKVHAVRWTSSQNATDLQTSGKIGPDGGTLSIAGTNFTIVFPQGALDAETDITITSVGDGYVDYDMEPHGLQFARPVIVTQGLAGVQNFSGSVFCAYLEPGQEIAADGTAIAAEVEKSTLLYSVLRLLGLAKPVAEVWSLNHFSRYILASD